MYDTFEGLETAVIAISQEDKDLDSAGRMAANFQPEPRFELLHDLDRSETLAYDRTTLYLIDKQGVVRQIFPMLAHMRPDWRTILQEVERLEDGGSGTLNASSSSESE